MNTTQVPKDGGSAQGALFDENDLPASSGKLPRQRPEGAAPRVRTPLRNQIELRASDQESLIADDHPVRSVWAFVQTMDLSHLYGRIVVVEGAGGAPAIDPAILVSLWLWATVDGVGSAREVDRLCERDDAYRWICGGVGVNYHTLSDFRTSHAAWLDRQLTRSVAALVSSELVTLKTIAQDGLRVRASAKAASFRRRPTLQALLKDAQMRVKALRGELHEVSATGTRRQAAVERAAREREQRLQRAMAKLEPIEASPPAARRKGRKPRHPRGRGGPSSGGSSTDTTAEAAFVEEIRVSTSDPDARVMKMGDGGFRPAYSAQLAVDTRTQLIAAMDLLSIGSDMGQMAPMHEQIDERYGVTPTHWLADGGFARLAAIEQVSARGTQPVIPAPQSKDGGDPLRSRAKDSAHVRAWRDYMGTDQAKSLYPLRASTVECANAQLRRPGLTQFNVRGTIKCRAVLLWHALAHNLMRLRSLGWLQPA